MIKKIVINGITEIQDNLRYELQEGFFVETESGITLFTFLTESCSIPDNYIRDKVKTIFHNGNPIDNVYSVKLLNDSVVAISGAMPGIVGAMMRMGSPYASMRESITEKGGDIVNTGVNIHVKLKLFNVILDDLGTRFIESGIILERENIIRIIRKSEHNRGSGFLFKIDNNTADSSKPEILKDAKYIIAAVN